MTQRYMAHTIDCAQFVFWQEYIYGPNKRLCPVESTHQSQLLHTESSTQSGEGQTLGLQHLPRD